MTLFGDMNLAQDLCAMNNYGQSKTKIRNS